MITTVNGVKLAYSDMGQGRPCVLLVHGFPLNRSMWDPQIGALRAFWRVIAPDLRGFGASEAGPPGPLSMEQHADDLAALLDALGMSEPVVYCGLSMGGYVGFAFWRRHPQRVRAFVFADTRAFADTPEIRRNRQAQLEAIQASGTPQATIDAMLPVLFSPSLPGGAPQEHLVRGMMSSTPAAQVASGLEGLMQRPDSVALLPSITVPALVIVGEHDRLTPPADSLQLAAGLPHAQLVTIDQAGHMANMENPDAFNTALVQFISSLPR